MLHHVNIGLKVKQCVHQIPAILMEATIQPITRTVLRVRLTITPDFRWNDQVTIATTAQMENNGSFVSEACVVFHKDAGRRFLNILSIKWNDMQV